MHLLASCMHTACMQVNVAGLVLAGSADFKNDLALSDMFDQRLQAKVLKIVDVSYGGDNGFNQAIELASETYDSLQCMHIFACIYLHAHNCLHICACICMHAFWG